MKEMNRVVITGVGIVSSIGNKKTDFIESLKNGNSGIKFHQVLKDNGLKCHLGGKPDISKEKISEYLTDEDLIVINEKLIYTLLAGIDCWRDAGFEYNKNIRKPINIFTDMVNIFYNLYKV